MRTAIKRNAELSTIRLIKWTIITTIYLVVAAMLLPVALYTMPDIESRFFPPIKDQRAEHVHYDPLDNHYLLWEWSFIKTRKAYPYYVTFMAYSASNELARYAVDTYVDWDCQRNMRSDRTNLPSKERQSRKLCIRLPDELAGKPDVRVDGIIDFKVGHDLYTVPITIPSTGEDISAGIPYAPSVR